MSQQGPVPELRVLSEALLQAWGCRSAAERQSFEQRIGAVLNLLPANPSDNMVPETVPDTRPLDPDRMLYPRPLANDDRTIRASDAPVQAVQGGSSEEEIASLARAIERIAAVSGSINPLRFRAVVADRLADMALDRIAPGFDRTRTDSSWEWTLRSDRRAAILGSLSHPDLIDELERARRIDTDAAGDAFRTLLLKGALRRGEATLSSEVAAYTWLNLVEPSEGAPMRRLRLENARSLILKAYDHLLIEGFVGRTKDIDRLRAFARRPRDGGYSRVLSVTGIGGVGKSTLLAEALRPVIARSYKSKAAPIVVSIDFDVGTQAQGAELELSFELTRQIELFYPETGPELEALRETVTRDRVLRGELNREKFDSERESVERHGYEFANRARPIFEKFGIGGRPLLLIVDTFEEWQRAQFGRWDSDHPIRRFLAWVAEIQSSWDLRADVIVCGRAPVSAEGLFESAGVVELTDLKRSEAVELLRKQGIIKREAQVLARIAGGNPLALKLAARYYRRLPVQGRSDFLAEGAQEMEGLDATLRQGILYRRFLDHIGDPKARKLAHPGLALRRVTIDLVQHVLAGSCGLGEVNHAEAEDLLLRLAREVWLVEGRWPVITHRPELRRVMLRAMKLDPAQSAKIEEVHRAALRWYETRGDNSEEDLTEAAYHRLAVADLAGDPVDFNAIPKHILLRIAPSAGDFEMKLRAELLYRTGRSLSAAEAAFLPPKARQNWAQSRAASLVRAGQPEQAITLWEELAHGAVPGAWYSAAAFQSLGRRDVAMAFEVNADPQPESLRYDYLLAFSLRHRAPDKAARYRHWLRQAMSWQLEKAEEREITPIALEALYFAAITDEPTALLHRRRMSANLIESSSLATTQQYLRIRQIFGDSLPIPNAKFFHALLSSFFSPTRKFLDRMLWTRVYRTASGTRLQEFAEEFEAEFGQGLSSDQLLGSVADRFASAVLEDMDRAGWTRQFISDLLSELRSDDPEWRVPIRAAVADAARAPWFREHLAYGVAAQLGSDVPTDLLPPALMSASARSGRKAWSRAIEYLDRANRLGHFMRSCLEIGDPGLRFIAHEYVEWDELRWQHGL